mmetsp:Transcript_35281/g.116913  ORF Transcript_35281/g.116913 Transcript_35281/m.116913 type:complete len:213 (+) Transcript_35281:174-812(+)
MVEGHAPAAVLVPLVDVCGDELALPGLDLLDAGDPSDVGRRSTAPHAARGNLEAARRRGAEDVAPRADHSVEADDGLVARVGADNTLARQPQSPHRCSTPQADVIRVGREAHAAAGQGWGRRGGLLRVRFILCSCIAAAAREFSIPGVSRALHVPLGEGAVELRVRAQRAVLAVHLQRGKPISQRRRLGVVFRRNRGRQLLLQLSDGLLVRL